MAIALLVLYVAGSVEFEAFHQLKHAKDELVLHSAKNELDPCHRTLFHQKAEEGCDHKSHVVEDDRCPLCILAGHYEVVTLPHQYLGNESHHSKYNSLHAISFNLLIDYKLPARAPPII
jgi:hypothetical protein